MSYISSLAFGIACGLFLASRSLSFPELYQPVLWVIAAVAIFITIGGVYGFDAGYNRGYADGWNHALGRKRYASWQD